MFLCLSSQFGCPATLRSELMHGIGARLREETAAVVHFSPAHKIGHASRQSQPASLPDSTPLSGKLVSFAQKFTGVIPPTRQETLESTQRLSQSSPPIERRHPCPEDLTIKEEWSQSGKSLSLRYRTSKSRWWQTDLAHVFAYESSVDTEDFHNDRLKSTLPSLDIQQVEVSCLKKGLCADAVKLAVTTWREHKGLVNHNDFMTTLTFAAMNKEIAGCICYLRAMMEGHGFKNIYVTGNYVTRLIMYPKLVFTYRPEEPSQIKKWCISNLGNRSKFSSPNGLYQREWTFTM